jgi:hypothetical protein
MDHQHTSKVIEWGFDEKYNTIPVKYGCAECHETYTTIPIYAEIPSDHNQHDDYIDGCFACKIRTLELNTGDAGRSNSMSDKKWTAELDAYADARSQGIQPAGTTMKAVAEAKEASDKLGVAFNAESMPAASKITKQSAKVMKETGVV